MVDENGEVTTPQVATPDNSMIIGIGATVGVVVVIILLAVYFFKVTPHARTPVVCTVRSAVSVWYDHISTRTDIRKCAHAFITVPQILHTYRPAKAVRADEAE